MCGGVQYWVIYKKNNIRNASKGKIQKENITGDIFCFTGGNDFKIKCKQKNKKQKKRKKYINNSKKLKINT